MNSYLEAEEKEIKEVFESGIIPESEGKVIPHLFVEADGTNIALQRKEARQVETKAGIAYEGWQAVKATIDLSTRWFTAALWMVTGFEKASLALAKKYNPSKMGRVIVGG